MNISSGLKTLGPKLRTLKTFKHYTKKKKQIKYQGQIVKIKMIVPGSHSQVAADTANIWLCLFGCRDVAFRQRIPRTFVHLNEKLLHSHAIIVEFA